MQEDFLHYLWRFKKFDFIDLKTVDEKPVVLLDSGKANFNSGPDFFNAKLQIEDQLWAGNVEIHIKSSDWYLHNHQQDVAYDNVILHVVWENDADIFRKDNSKLPVVELKDRVSAETQSNYRSLLLAPNRKWINCENEFPEFSDFEVNNWLERMYLEKLQQKSELILALLSSSENDWEGTLFRLLCKNFGLNINGTAFLSLAQSFDFKILQKIQKDQEKLEALFFGQAGMLDEKIEDPYFRQLQNEYKFLCRKYGLKNALVERPKFFRLRPDNFPNIRLSQLSVLYSQISHLFSRLLEAKDLEQIKELMQVGVSPYWKEHYTFEKPHKSRKKILSESFINLLIINTILPVKFCYFQKTGTGEVSEILNIMQSIPAEENKLVQGFNKIRKSTATNAMQSQALLYLKQNYCDKNACLNCNLGIKILQGTR